MPRRCNSHASQEVEKFAESNILYRKHRNNNWIIKLSLELYKAQYSDLLFNKAILIAIGNRNEPFFFFIKCVGNGNNLYLISSNFPDAMNWYRFLEYTSYFVRRNEYLKLAKSINKWVCWCAVAYNLWSVMHFNYRNWW